jgi:hypothetical protein
VAGYWEKPRENVANEMLKRLKEDIREAGADRAVLSIFSGTDELGLLAKRVLPFWRRGLKAATVQHWKTSLPTTIEEFLGKRPKKHRYWLRRIGKVFESQFPGKVRYAIYTSSLDVDDFCQAAERVAQLTYQRGLGAGFIDNTENRRRLSLMANCGCWRSYVVYIENKPVAFWSGELFGNTFFLTWTGFDPSYRKYEIGTILFLKMVEDLLSFGIKEMDYGLGWAQYKERFGDICLFDQDVIIYASTLKAFGLNLIFALEGFFNSVGKKLLSTLKVRDKFKKMWRSGLADKTNHDEEHIGHPLEKSNSFSNQ